MRDEEVVHPEWPGVKLYGEETLTRLIEALKFSDSLNIPDHGGSLRDRMEYLQNYSLDKLTGRRRFSVLLTPDWAQHSFGVLWKDTLSGKTAFNGGLICHVSGEDPLTVSMTEQAWGIHT